MAAPPLPCDSCGSPISDSALESGEAINLLGKRYCGDCKSEAVQSVSLDDLSGKAPPAQAAPVRKAAARPAPPVPKAPPPRPAPTAVRAPAAPARRESPTLSRKPPVAPKSSRTPLIVAAILVVALLAGGYVAFKPSPPPEKPVSGGPTPPKTTPAAASDQAKAAYLKVEEISRRAGVSAELLLSAIAQAQPACKGSEWEKRLEDLRAKALKEKEAEDSAKDLAPLIDELKGAVATDTEFKRYSELQPKFQLAIETAGRTQSARLTEIRALQRDYNSRYEKLAEPYTVEISEAANALAEERRYDDAIRKIETFPPQFRNSGSWTVLQKLKADIERRKKQLPPKK